MTIISVPLYALKTFAIHLRQYDRFVMSDISICHSGLDPESIGVVYHGFPPYAGMTILE